MTGVVIPLIDPAFPDPLNAVNVSVINAPNARSEGAHAQRYARRLFGAACQRSCKRMQAHAAFVRLAAAAHWPPVLPPHTLPRPAELLVDLPLAYFVPPISTNSGQLPLVLDLERKR